MEKRITVYNPKAITRRPRSELARSTPAIEYLTEPDYLALLKVSKANTKYPEHWLWIALLWQTGLRVSEALHLTRDTVYPDGLNILHGKGDKQRFVPCQQTILGDLIRYQQTHGQQRIFQKLTTEPGVLYMLRRYGVKAGITKRIHPHLFRHSFAINFLRQTKDPFALQKIGGWSDMETVKIYMRLAIESPREAIDKMNFPEVL